MLFPPWCFTFTFIFKPFFVNATAILFHYSLSYPPNFLSAYMTIYAIQHE
jgi:hypothetical protein